LLGSFAVFESEFEQPSTKLVGYGTSISTGFLEIFIDCFAKVGYDLEESWKKMELTSGVENMIEN